MLLFSMVLFAADTATEPIWTPLIQLGFAGFSGILLAIIVWLIRRLLEAHKDSSEAFRENSKVIQANTQAIIDIGKTSADQIQLLHKLYEKLITRPCIVEREQPTI